MNWRNLLWKKAVFSPSCHWERVREILLNKAYAMPYKQDNGVFFRTAILPLVGYHGWKNSLKNLLSTSRRKTTPLRFPLNSAYGWPQWAQTAFLWIFCKKESRWLRIHQKELKPTSCSFTLISVQLKLSKNTLKHAANLMNGTVSLWV